MRLVAVIESIDNGKPIRESRDCDIPNVIRHLYHHAGWAELMDTEMKGMLGRLVSACIAAGQLWGGGGGITNKAQRSSVKFGCTVFSK